MQTYPLINLIVRRKTALATAAGITVFGLFAASAALLSSPLLVVLGLILGGVAWFLSQLLGEIVQVIAETLLPR